MKKYTIKHTDGTTKQVFENELSQYGIELPKAKSGIKIKPENRGKFNATKKATGKTTEELTHSKNPVTKKRAIFAQNASHWKHENGGMLPMYGNGGLKPPFTQYAPQNNQYDFNQQIPTNNFLQKDFTPNSFYNGYNNPQLKSFNQIQQQPQLNFNTNFSPTAQDYDNFDERDYNNPQGTYQPSSYAPINNVQNSPLYNINDPYKIGESVNGSGQQRTPYQIDQLPPLYDSQNLIPNQKYSATNEPLVFNPDGTNKNFQNTQSGYNLKDGYKTAAYANQLVRQGQMFTKDFVNNVAAGISKNQANKRETGYLDQSLVANAEKGMPYSLYGEGVGGSNALAENGTKVKAGVMNLHRPNGYGATIEAENRETYANMTKPIAKDGVNVTSDTPDENQDSMSGMIDRIGGKFHEDGGTPLAAKPGDFIFTNNKIKDTFLIPPLIEKGILKPSDKGKSWASVVNKFNTKNAMYRKNIPSADSIQIASALKEIEKAQENTKIAFYEGQEPEKLYGFQGKKAQLEAIQSMRQEQQEQQMQPGQEQNQMPMGKNGMKLPKYVNAGRVKESNRKKITDVDYEKRFGASNQTSSLDNFARNQVNTNTANPIVNPIVNSNIPSTSLQPIVNTPQISNEIINGQYVPTEAFDIVKNFSTQPNFRYSNDPKNLQAGKNRYLEQMRTKGVLTTELAEKIMKANSFQELNPLAEGLQNYDYAKDPEVSQHYGMHIPATRKGLDYLVKYNVINPKDYPTLFDKSGKAIVGTMLNPSDRTLANSIQEKVDAAPKEFKKGYAEVNLKDGEAFFRDPEIKSFKFKTNAEKDAYLKANKDNIYGNAVYSGTEGLYLIPESEEQPTAKEPPKSDPVGKTKYTNLPLGQKKFEMPMINFAMPTLASYNRDQLNYYNTNPNFVDPRLDPQQARLNDIDRNTRAMYSNIGGRGTADIANLAQTFLANDAAKQQVYGDVYSRNTQEKARADQYNAGEASRVHEQNRTAFHNYLENPRRMREGILDTQLRTDSTASINDLRKNIRYGNDAGYIKEKFDPELGGFNWNNQSLNPESLKANEKALWKKDWEKKQYLKQLDTEAGISKNGGKVKIKPKIKLRK